MTRSVRLSSTRTDTQCEAAVERIPAVADTRCVRWRDLAKAAGHSWAASMNIRTHEHARLPDEDLMMMSGR